MIGRLDHLVMIVNVLVLTVVVNLAWAYVSFPVIHRRQSAVAKRQLVTRDDGSVSAELQHGTFSYYAQLKLGSPAQTVSVSLDTGSSDLWVPDSSKGSSNQGFDPSKSSSLSQVNGDTATFSYVMGTANGHFVKDTVEIGDSKIDAVQFAVVSSQQGVGSDGGILGIGLPDNESGNDRYPNLPQTLVDAGLVKRNAYSLYLSNITASTGSILFGAIDQAKYSGELTKVPATDKTRLSVEAKVNGTDGSTVDALLDSGTTLIYLPDDVVQGIAKAVGAQWDDDIKAYVLQSQPSEELQFEFGNSTISVPPSEYVPESSQLFPKASQPYVLATVPNSQSQNLTILGDAFLRSAYVVFDLEDNSISIGQARYTEESDIKELA